MKILVIDDDPSAGALIKGWLKPQGYQIEYMRVSSDAVAPNANLQQFDLIIIDKQMPEIDGLQLGKKLKQDFPDLVTIMTTGYETRETLIAAFRDSHFDDYLSKPFKQNQLQDALLRAQNLIEERQALSNEYQLNKALRTRSVERPHEMIGQSPRFQEVTELVSKVAPLDVPVLIRGETGTGKELIARALYTQSQRSRGPFVTVNCGAIPKDLFESELFGHEKGAFTGAFEKKEGLIKLAHGGTLFLDEIGDMSLPLQVKILRALQEKEIMPIGGKKPISVDVRFISATNRNLEEMIQKEEFREDLLYRINVFTVKLPPLRERVEDIPALARSFIEKNAHLNSAIQGIETSAMNMLQHWEWKGNIREMENTIQRAVALTNNDYLKCEDFPEIYNSPLLEPQFKTTPASPPASINPVHNLQETPTISLTKPSRHTAVPFHGTGHTEKLWKYFLKHDHKLWKILNSDEVHVGYSAILEQAEYIKIGHFGRLCSKLDRPLKLELSYLNPTSSTIEEKTLIFLFNQKHDLSAAQIKEEIPSAMIQPMLKGLPDTYLFNLLYPPAKRNQSIAISPQHMIRALVLRYAQMQPSIKPLKKIFAEVMGFLTTENLKQQYPILPNDGVEAMRGFLCSRVHVFSGYSRLLKRSPELIADEIHKVFPMYQYPYSSNFTAQGSQFKEIFHS
ncbi:MAG: sigma-54-dependent Fis family transcriptional regulator [SAR324 cluster bacterium]|nr:sigma-54-dependent Fis family transcriptional regulator [SAR324 cluster bacterium]